MYLQQQYTTIGVRVANALFYYGGVLKNICAVVFCFLIFFIFGFWFLETSLFLVARHLLVCSLGASTWHGDTATLTDSTTLHRLYTNLSTTAVCHTCIDCDDHLPFYAVLCAPLPSSIFHLPLDSIRTPSLSSFVLYSVPLLKLKYEAILFQLFTCRPPTCQTLRTGPLLTFHFPLDCPTYLWSFQRNQNVNYLCTMYFQVGMWSLGWAIGVQLRCPPTNWKQIEEREVCWRSPHSSHAVYQTHFSTKYCSSGRPTCCRAVRQDHCWALIWCSWLNWHFGV